MGVVHGDDEGVAARGQVAGKEYTVPVGDDLARLPDRGGRKAAYRLGIVLRDIDEKRAHVLAERIRRTVEVNKFIWEGTRIRVTISLGVATLRRANFRDANELVAAADEYLYKAKRAGRNRVASPLR